MQPEDTPRQTRMEAAECPVVGGPEATALAAVVAVTLAGRSRSVNKASKAEEMCCCFWAKEKN